MTRRRIAIVALVGLLVAAGVVWWKLGRGGGDAKPATAAGPDPWDSNDSGDRALAAKKRAARGDAPVDVSPASLAGHVRRAADGSGVAGAVVAVTTRQFAGAMFGAAGGEEALIAISDASGAWRLDDVPPGRRVVTATAIELLPASLDLDLAPRAARTGVDLTLAAGGATLSGTVSDIGGGPVAQARVTIRPDGMRVLDSSSVLVAVTGDDGRYRMTLPADSWHATASANDYADEDRSFVIRDQPITLDFSLTPGGTIRGQVIARDTGAPLPGARVTASGGHGGRDDDLGGLGGVVADDDGRFTLRGLGSGALSLSASGEGYASTDPTVVEVGIGEELDGVQVMVDRAYDISGFVVRKGTEGDGVPGVRVGVFSITKGWNVFAPQPSAADGYFEILGVRAATYMVVAMGDGVMLEIGKSVTVKDRDLTDVIVTMDAGTTLSGRVTPPAVTRLGLGMDPANIGLGNMFDVARAAMVRGSSDETGAFTLHNAPHGSFDLVAQAADGRGGKLAVTIGDADQTGLVVELENRGAISGKVVDTNRAPVAGVKVNARVSGKGMALTMDDGPTETVTAFDGSYRVAGLEAGEVELSVSDDHGELAWAESAKVDDTARVTRTLAAAEELRDVVLTVEARDGVIRGVVLGLDRAPVADVWVSARSTDSPWARRMRAMRQEAGDDDGVKVEVSDDQPDDDSQGFSSDGAGGKTVLTGADGRFTITQLRRGTYGLVAVATKGGMRGQRTGVKTGDNVTLVMERLGVLSGLVSSGGAPVASYDLDCDGPGDQHRRHVAAADGRYRLERLPQGKYRCTATADAGTAAGETRLEGAAGTLDLALTGWASVTGVVVGADGKPRPGLAVVASGEGGNTGEELAAILGGEGITTDAAGRFEVTRLGAGNGSLMIFDRAEGFSPLVTKELVLVAGQRLDVGTLTATPPPAPTPTPTPTPPPP